ncbi:MAG: barstar family protein [Erysipelotrichaceae bacterium]|nr:barstar family protein [Erysipelotrichaceae bacterium]
MKEIVLDGKQMTSKLATHLYIADMMQLSQYHGDSLDGLRDVLVAVNEKTQININHLDDIRYYLAEYTDNLLAVFNDAAKINSNVIINLI